MKTTGFTIQYFVNEKLCSCYIQSVHWDFMDISATPSVFTHGMERYAVSLARITQTTVPRPIATLL